MCINLKNNPIWYQFENHTANMVRTLSGKELMDFCEEIKLRENLEIAAHTCNCRNNTLAFDFIITIGKKERKAAANNLLK